MKRIAFTLSLLLLLAGMLHAEGYKIGDKATDFSLKNVDGKYISLKDYEDAKGYVVVFTCNECPYAKAYQDRLIEIDKKYKKKGYPVIAINPNDPEVSKSDTFEKMVERAKEKNFPFPYLVDEKQEIFRAYGATRTPHIFVLKKEGKDYIVSYIGAIDNNYKDPDAVTEAYLASALDALLTGSEPEPKETKAIGCTIKVKK
jgi:peroxiredoxin